MSADAAENADWIDARTAAKILRVPGPRNVHRLVERNLLHPRDLPGVRARYSRAEVEALATDAGRAKARRGFAYLFGATPQPRSGESIVSALAAYREARAEALKADPLTDESAFADGTVMALIFAIADPAVRLLNGEIDQNLDAFVVEAGLRDDAGRPLVGVGARLFLALSRLASKAEAELMPDGGRVGHPGAAA